MGYEVKGKRAFVAYFGEHMVEKKGVEGGYAGTGSLGGDKRLQSDIRRL